MKREGRQHGMVRTYRILPSQSANPVPRFVNRIDTPPTAGLFTKVSSKPTNHSKSTGLKPTKSKRRNNYNSTSNKQQKIRLHYSDDPVFAFAGTSASGILSYLYGRQEEEEDDENGYDYDQGDEVDQIPSCYKCDDILKTDVSEIKPDGGQDDDGLQASNENEVNDDDVVIDEDCGCVTISQVVIVLEKEAQMVDDEQDWCFVQADDEF